MAYLAIAGVSVAIWLVYQWVLFRIDERKVRHIPTVGPDGFISSYIAAWKFVFKGKDLVQEGYDKYKGTAFKIPTLMTPNRWLIVLTGSSMIEDVRKCSTERELSFMDALYEILQKNYVTTSLADKTWENTYNTGVIRGPMTRAFPSQMADLKDEVESCFREMVPRTKEWTPVQAQKTMVSTICRTTNRLFVGLPLCRDPEYCRIQESLTIHMFTVSSLLGLIPEFMRSFVGRILSKFPSNHAKVTKMVYPLFNERMEMDEKHGRKWEGRPNDMISWLLDAVPEEGSFKTVEDMTMRIIFANMGAIHTTSITVTNALFDLAARPEYAAPLREEIEEAVEEMGWSKEAMDRLHKLDSFLKESTRLAGIVCFGMHRKARNDYTFSNGVVVPKGFRTAIASVATYLDPDVYEDPDTFDGFRFVKNKEGSNGDSARDYQGMVSLNPSYLIFGGGRPACPGRYLAVNEAKLVLAHVLLNYDIKLPNDRTTPPEPFWIGESRAMDPKAEILFRRRQ
ncbi:cytochrome P450 [Coprinopsis cinerea AmutBmut pab1-1]|nr:cytochrome P450 [Coprinopsis cinerea AmutBmut pab1-1]